MCPVGQSQQPVQPGRQLTCQREPSDAVARGFHANLTGNAGLNPWPRGPNTTGGYQLGAPFGTLPEQALGALVSHAEATGVVSQHATPE